MFNAMGSSNPQDLGNGGTIDGDLVITGDLQVSGGGSLSFDEIIEGTQQIKVTNTSALLVEKADGTDILTVDTTNSEVELGVDVKLKIKDSSYSGQLSINSSGYTELQALGDRSIDLKSQRQIRMYTSDDGASYTQALNLSSTGGNATFLGTVTVGADGSGKDVTFYSATAGDSLVWDASEEKLTITGTDSALALDIADGYVKVQESLSITNGSGSFYVWSDDPFGSNYEVLRIDKPSGANARLSVYKGGTGTYRGLEFETGGSSRMTISASGDVDITGSITNATWTGDVIASAYLDADTAHLSGTQTFSGAKTFTGTLTTGVDDTGVDVKFFGATSGKYMMWDESGDDLIVSGAIGINGTPSYDLHIVGTRIQVDGDTPVIVLKDTSAYSQNTGAQLVFQGLDSASASRDFAFIQGSSRGSNDGALDFYTRGSGSNTLRMRIDEGGGTTFNGVVDITDTTDSSDDSGDTGALRVEGGASIAKKLYVGGSVSLENGLDVLATTTLKYETNSMTLTRDGGHLMVLRNSGSAIADGESLGYYRFNGKVGSSDEEVGVSIQAEADGAWTADTDCPARLEIHTNSGSSVTERMRIDKDGVITLGLNNASATSVGIGASPSVVANTTKLNMGSSSTAVSQIRLIDNEATDGFYIESNLNFAIGYNTTDVINITQAGVVQLDQGQLKFPASPNASSDPNTMDDWETGSWTPTIKAYGDDSKAMTMNSGSTGTYTKIGNLVVCTGFVATTANGGVDSNLHIALYDLPFTISNGGSGMESRSGLAGVNAYGLAITAGHTIGGFGIGNTVKVYLTEHNSSLGYIALLRDKWTADGEMTFSFSYNAA